MGKSNRIRANRAKAAVKAPTATKTQKKKQGMPSWLMTLITIAVAVVILASVALSVLASSGLPNRLRTSMKSENFTVNTNMMSYYFYTTYQNFQTNYESYMDYFSLDTSASMKDQPFGGNKADTSSTTTYYDTYLLGTFEGTWFDYFVKETKSQVTSMLLYLEEANARGITLTDEEKAQIKASLDSTTAAMSLYYASANAYFADVYGKGVNKSDVLKAMEYSTLATKAMNAVTEELDAAITDEIVDKTYGDKKKEFDVIDYTFYLFDVDYDEVAKETLGEDFEKQLENNTENQAKVLEAYKAAIAKAKTDAENLMKAGDAEAVKKEILKLAADKNYDTLYSDAKAADSKGSLTDAELAEIRTAIIDEAVANAMGEKKDSAISYKDGEETGTAYGKTVSVAFAKALDTLKNSMATKMTSTLSSYVLEKVNHVEEDEFSEWAFADGRAAGETKIVVEGDGSKETIENKDGYTYVTAYLLRETPRKDTEKTRNVIYALFSSETSAESAIKALKEKGTLDHATFEAVADEYGTTGHANVDDCMKGMMGSTAFDTWLFDDKLTVGAITEAPIAMDNSTYCVAYYEGEGAETWKVTVENSILNENFEAYYTAMEGKYAIVTKDKSFKKIDA